jgi:hypothetical protein
VDKESCIVAYKLALFNAFFFYKNLNSVSKLKYQEFLVQEAKVWSTAEIQAAKTQTQTQCDLDDQLTPHIGLMWTPMGNFSVICGNVLGKIVKSEHGKRKYPARQCHVCAVHKKSQSRYICELCLVPLYKGDCFQRYHTLKHF